jgi:voltage-gated potassium channel
MKAIKHILDHLNTTQGRQNVVIFRNFFFILTLIIFINSIIFHWIMEREQVLLPHGKNHNLDNDLLIAVYWVLITMSTVGYGDITFETHLGQFFSLAVMMSGVVYLFILLPFSFMEFFYKPLVKLQSESKVPREGPEELRNHVIFTCYDSIAKKLMERLKEFDYPFIFLLNSIDQAIQLVDRGIPVIYGHFDDPDSYRNARIGRAVMLVATSNDVTNTNVAFTARSVRPEENFKIVSLSSHPASDDVLELAGSTQVLKLPHLMAEFFLSRIEGGERNAHIVGRFQDLYIAEARARHTSLVGRTIRSSNLRDQFGLIVLGTMEHGHFTFADLDKEIKDNTTLLMAGTRLQFKKYNHNYNPDGEESTRWENVIIIGGGRVGKATAESLLEHKIPYVLIDQNEEKVNAIPHAILGNAAELSDLKRAGLDKATAIIITTHDDEMNIFLTIYLRKLREDVHIFSRAHLERNLNNLKNAGANYVISYDATGATTILNHLSPDNLVTITEGLELFRCMTPEPLWNKTVLDSRILPDMNCIVVAIIFHKQMKVNPGATDLLTRGSELILMGSTEAERNFVKTYSPEIKPSKYR